MPTVREPTVVGNDLEGRSTQCHDGFSAIRHSLSYLEEPIRQFGTPRLNVELELSLANHASNETEQSRIRNGKSLEGDQLLAASFNALLERLLPVRYIFLRSATPKRIMREQFNLSSQTDDLSSQLGHPEILLVLIQLALLLE